MNFGAAFALPGAGELIAWSRILNDEEALCIVNGHGAESRGAYVVVDASLNAPSAPGDPWAGAPPFFTVIANSAQIAAGPAYSGSHPVGQQLAVERSGDSLFVPIRKVAASEALVLSNRP